MRVSPALAFLLYIAAGITDMQLHARATAGTDIAAKLASSASMIRLARTKLNLPSTPLNSSITKNREPHHTVADPCVLHCLCRFIVLWSSCLSPLGERRPGHS